MIERIALVFVIWAGLQIAKQSGWHEGFDAGRRTVMDRIDVEIDHAIARKLTERPS